MTNHASLLRRLLNDTQLKRDYSLRPAGLKWRSNKIFIVTTITVALWTDLFLYILVVPILPFMLQDRVGLPKGEVQSYVSALLAVFAGSSVLCSPLAGYLADGMSTRQAPFLGGLTAMFGATLLLMLGKTIPVLMVARVLQAVSAAFVWTIGMALCLETVGAKNLGKIIGTVFSFISLGPLVAPILGGVLYEKAGVAGVFGTAFGILGLDFIMRVLVIERKVAKRYEDYDGSDGEEDGSENGEEGEGQQDGAADEEQVTGEQIPLLGGQKEDTARWKIRKDLPQICQKIPILPCLMDPRLLVALLMAWVQASIFGSFDATIPTVAQDFYGFSSLKASLLFLPLAVSDLILGPVFGWCVDRFGTKPVAVIGHLYLVPIFVLLRLAQPGGMHEVLVYGGLLALCGMGLAAVGSPSIVEAGYVVEQYYQHNKDFFDHRPPYAQLYGLNNIAFSAGLTLGPELAGELRQVIGYGNMNAVLGAISGVTGILAWIYIGGKPVGVTPVRKRRLSRNR